MDEQTLEQQLALLDQYQSACTRCGLCSEGCITFQTSGWEHESPRGRIQLAQDFLNGKIQPASAALKTFDQCLGCHACETLCPMDVSYGKIRHLVQDLRKQLNPHRISQICASTYRQWIKTAKRLSSIWWRQWKGLLTPSGYMVKKHASQNIMEPEAVGLIVGCLQETLHPAVVETAYSCLKELGYQPYLFKNQPCCGAVFERMVEGGEESISYPSIRSRVAQLQSKHLQDFISWLPEKTYALSKGCMCYVNSKMQQLLMQDIYVLILETLILKNIELQMPKPLSVYYQPFCGNKRGEIDSVLEVLKKIKNLSIKMVNHPVACCGGYGGGNLCSSQDTMVWIACQLKGIPADAIVVVVSPECYQQVKLYSQTMEVIYPIQLVWQAIQRQD